MISLRLERGGHARTFCGLAATIVALFAFLATAVGAGAQDLYVKAGAASAGTGTQHSPMNDLAAVERVSMPGDRIHVVPSTEVLDGGIQLKRGQTLVGLGPDVAGNTSNLSLLPAISNTTAARLAGDAVRLATDATVENIAVRSAYRGAIYGLDTVGVRIIGNDVTNQNTSCTKGFLVQPFNIPTGIPFISIPATPIVAPQNGWAALMVDGKSASGSVAIERNYVHDAKCGDGIDIRTMASARLNVNIEQNTVTRIAQGSNLVLIGSVLAIGLQALDSSVIRATQDRNSQTFIGSADADCEGQFQNTAGAGQIYTTINRNTFAHGIGGFSCNGLEAVISTGSGRIDVEITNSTFVDNVGDMLQAANLGAGSTMNFVADNVVVDGTSERGGNPPGSSDGGLNPIPFNIGDCLLAGNNGGGSRTNVTVRNSHFTRCNNGISLFSNVGILNRFGPTKQLNATVQNSSIVDNARYGLHTAVFSPVDQYDVRFEATEVARNGAAGVSFEAPLANQFRGRFDLGKGALGSRGNNCFHGNRPVDLEATNLRVIAKSNWWGRAGTPKRSQVKASWLLGRITTDAGLRYKPLCGRL